MAKAVHKNFIISLDIYPFDVMVSVGEEDDTLFKRLRKLSISEDEFEMTRFDTENGRGRYCLFKTGASLIRLKQEPKTPEQFGTLQHEIFHCASSILWRVGIKLKMKYSDEAYAYLIGYLTEKIYYRLK